MTALQHYLLICDNDKFACIGGLPFFYRCEDVPAQAVKVNTDEAGNSHWLYDSEKIISYLRSHFAQIT